MACVFELAAECGPEREAAVSFAKHFEGMEIPLPDGRRAICNFRPEFISVDEEKNYWAEVMPSELSASGVRNEADAREMTVVAHALYERLGSAPPFRFALVGVETAQFNTAGNLPGLATHPSLRGLVVAHDFWVQLGKPTPFEPFSPGYLWRPYKGESPT